MSTPIFDALLAESDDTTRALVWDAVNPAIDLGTYIERMNRVGRALAQVAAVEPESELQHPGTWLPGDQVLDDDGDAWTRGNQTWSWVDCRTGVRYYGHVEDVDIDRDYFNDATPRPDVRITHLVPRTNGGE